VKISPNFILLKSTDFIDDKLFLCIFITILIKSKINYNLLKITFKLIIKKIKKIKIITSDGSPTLYIKEWNESFHSKHGAIQESNHVFIENGFNYWKSINKDKKVCSIFEMGFGTALNTFLTLKTNISKSLIIKYDSIEAFPLKNIDIFNLNYSDFIKDEILSKLYLKLHSSSWESSIKIHSNFILKKNKSLLKDYHINKQYDVIYYDAFGPRIQPEMWGINSLEPIINSLNINGVFVTYSAKGSVRRILESFNLIVERLPGPPGKREMLRGTRKLL